MSSTRSCIAYEQLCLRPSDGAATRGSLTVGRSAAAYYSELCRQAWYELVLLRGRHGFLDRDNISLGPDLLTGVLTQIGGLMPGVYAVRAQVWAPRRKRLPDWGCLIIRRGRRWVLRARDGSELICPDGHGDVATFTRGGGQWL
jgi:hypothetical protein